MEFGEDDLLPVLVGEGEECFAVNGVEVSTAGGLIGALIQSNKDISFSFMSICLSIGNMTSSPSPDDFLKN